MGSCCRSSFCPARATRVFFARQEAVRREPPRQPFLDLTPRSTTGKTVGPDDGKKKETNLEQKYEGKVYCSDKKRRNLRGHHVLGIYLIENHVWATCFKHPTERKKVLILFDAYQSHWEAPVLNCVRKHGFAGMIGVSKGLGFWQRAAGEADPLQEEV